jgi:hypothetical protein
MYITSKSTFQRENRKGVRKGSFNTPLDELECGFPSGMDLSMLWLCPKFQRIPSRFNTFLVALSLLICWLVCFVMHGSICPHFISLRCQFDSNCVRAQGSRGPHGYADMNTTIFSWIISADISMLLKFHEYEYGYALNIVVCVIDFFLVASGADIQSRYYHFVGLLSIEKWTYNGVFIG